MSAPANALADLAALLRADRSLVSEHVVDGAADAGLGTLAAAGPRTRDEAPEYALVVEAVREGYLLHYAPGATRVVGPVDADLALLAGDYLYALGLERLAALGDLRAVRELSDLISLAAELHDGSRDPDRAEREAAALWLACATAIAVEAGSAHEEAKRGLRDGDPGAALALWDAAREGADRGGFRQALGDAAAGLDFRSDHLPSLG